MVLAVATIESDDEVDFAQSDDEAAPLACELDGVADARSASSWDLVQSALGNDASADAHVIHWKGKNKPWKHIHKVRQSCGALRRAGALLPMASAAGGRCR